jgi:hypothetical protein
VKSKYVKGRPIADDVRRGPVDNDLQRAYDARHGQNTCRASCRRPTMRRLGWWGGGSRIVPGAMVFCSLARSKTAAILFIFVECMTPLWGKCQPYLFL